MEAVTNKAKAMPKQKIEKAVCAMLAMQRYSWEQGVCAQALYEAGRDELWIPMAYDAILRQQGDGRLAMIGSEVAASDPAANGEACLRAYEKTHNPIFLSGAQKMLKYLETAAPRTKDGIICHNISSFEKEYSPLQLWVDGMYMVPPFLACMGRLRETVFQIRGYFNHLYDEESGVFFHIVDTADGRFVRKKRWATGNGWALMGLARVIEAADSEGNADVKKNLLPRFDHLLRSMLNYQLQDGRFHDILDDPETFVDGTSALMMATAVFRGVLHGYVPAGYLSYAEKALNTADSKIDEMGLLHEVCGAPHFISEGTSAEAQAAYIMATAWRSRLSESRI